MLSLANYLDLTREIVKQAVYKGQILKGEFLASINSIFQELDQVLKRGYLNLVLFVI